MVKLTSKMKRKTIKSFVISMIAAIVLIISTYAWFTGISTVNTNTFNVSVEAKEDMEISLDGEEWKKHGETLNISENTIINNAYENHTNKWASSLYPLSTNGSFDSSTSRLKFYEKSSLSTTHGGYRLIATRQNIIGAEEGNGYIAFDLFIKNGKSKTYNTTYDKDSDEDIYLTADSYATVPTEGAVNDGVANSIRIGFFEIGRIQANGYDSENESNVSQLTGIKCNSSSSSITTICAEDNQLQDRLSYSWNIWEPNYTSHGIRLVNYFNKICKKKTGRNAYSDDSCAALYTSARRLTYAVNSDIDTNDDVDIYDGKNINSYPNSSKLTEMSTYKTTDATAVGTTKKPLIRLSGNSITKVRVYIWVEGQDIDNYDIIQNQSMNIKFGFTKDRLGLDNINNTARTNRASSFADDSWEKIKTNITNNNTSQYHIGDTREIRIGDQAYTLRLANKSTNANCSNQNYSQTACGFVVEFADAVDSRQMNADNNIVGWPASELYAYLQETFYDKLPSDLKQVVRDTKVISGYGNNGSSNYTTTDKLYLLSGVEIFGSDSSDTAASTTHQLDYYKNMPMGAPYYYDCGPGCEDVLDTYPKTIKQYNGSNIQYWLRSSNIYGVRTFRHVSEFGYFTFDYAYDPNGVAPAFRIG